MTYHKSLLVFLICLIGVSCSRRKSTDLLVERIYSIRCDYIDPRPLAAYLIENQDLLSEPVVWRAMGLPDRGDPEGFATVAGVLASVFYHWQDYAHAIYFARVGLQQGEDYRSLRVMAWCAAEEQKPSLIQDFTVRQQQIVGKLYPVFKLMAAGKAENAIDILSPMVFTNQVKVSELKLVARNATWLAKAYRRTKNCEKGLSCCEDIWKLYFGSESGEQEFVNLMQPKTVTNGRVALAEYAIDICFSAQILSKQCHNEQLIQLWYKRGKVLVEALCRCNPNSQQYRVLLLPKFEQ